MSADETFEVSFASEGPLGLHLAPGSLAVTAIDAGLGVAKYNTSGCNQQIKVGDRITTLDGEKATMNTIKNYEGGNNVTLGVKRPAPVVGKPVATAPQQMVMGGGNRPAGVPPDASFVQETYAGPNTTMFAIGGCICCGPIALCICLCPVDERSVWVAKDGRRWTKEGARLGV